jgi:hypothetical protein
MPFAMPYTYGEEHFAIAIIKKELEFLNTTARYPEFKMENFTPGFDMNLAKQFKTFQKYLELPTMRKLKDIKIDRDDLTQLFTERTWQAEQEYRIPGGILHGIFNHESWFDPGATGPDGKDHGIAMFRVDEDINPGVTVDMARDPAWCIPQAGKRLRDRYGELKALAQDENIEGWRYRIWDAVILSHNAPTNAREFFRTGEYVTEKNENYVKYVKAGAWTP